MATLCIHYYRLLSVSVMRSRKLSVGKPSSPITHTQSLMSVWEENHRQPENVLERLYLLAVLEEEERSFWATGATFPCI